MAVKTLSDDIKGVIEQAAGPVKAKEVISAVTNSANTTESSVRSELVKMKGKGEVVQPRYGYYDLPERQQAPKRKQHPEPAEPPGMPTAVKTGSDDVIRWEMDVNRASAGEGAYNEDAAEKEVIVRSRTELRQETRRNPDTLQPILIQGHSMEPEIRANTLAFYVPMREPEGSGIYVVNLGSRTVVKVLEIMGGDALKLSSKNKEDFPDPEIFVPLEGSEEPDMYRSRSTGLVSKVVVVGRVVSYHKAT